MRWAVGSGLLKAQHRLNPKATATRAETAMILMRFMETFAVIENPLRPAGGGIF